MIDPDGFLAIGSQDRLNGATVESICLTRAGIMINFSTGAFINYFDKIELSEDIGEKYLQNILISQISSPLIVGCEVVGLEVESPTEMIMRLSSGALLRFTLQKSSGLEAFVLTYPDHSVMIV